MERVKLLDRFKRILVVYINNEQTQAFEHFNESIDLVNDLQISAKNIEKLADDLRNKFKINITSDSIRKDAKIGHCLKLIQNSICSRCSKCSAFKTNSCGT